MTNKSAPVKNELLAALPRAAYLCLLTHLKSTQLQAGAGPYNSGRSIEHIYFPEDALVSLVTHTRGGATVEAGLIAAVRGGIAQSPAAHE